MAFYHRNSNEDLAFISTDRAASPRRYTGTIKKLKAVELMYTLTEASKLVVPFRNHFIISTEFRVRDQGIKT